MQETSKKTMEELGRYSPEVAKQQSKHNLIVILDDIRSMHNVGSVFRTCDAFAVSELWLCGYTPTPPHRDIHKTALGATGTVHWRHFTTIKEAILQCRANDCAVYAVEQVHNSISLPHFKWDEKPLAIIFGNEVTGVQEDAIKLADGCIEIPQWGAKHSLNVSVSTGVVIWELVRQIAIK